MSRVFKKIDNNISHTRAHEHAPDEREMNPNELRQHLVKYHGWTVGQLLMSRTQGPDGEKYMASWHKNDHVPLRSPE